WGATTLEWVAPSPPPHLNWGAELPTVHRWAYDYSVPGAESDFISQTVPAVPERADAVERGARRLAPGESAG
ncbi:MAG TPA: hypothetical protein VF234_05965, partial [Limnochordia bacterium]